MRLRMKKIARKFSNSFFDELQILSMRPPSRKVKIRGKNRFKSILKKYDGDTSIILKKYSISVRKHKGIRYNKKELL